MHPFKQKYKKTNLINHPVTWVILLILTLLILISALKRYSIAREMSERREEIDQEIVALEERRDSLEDEVKYISSERGKEAEMRRQFDMARKGEKVVIVLDEKEEKEVEEATTTEEEKEKRPWYKFW